MLFERLREIRDRWLSEIFDERAHGTRAMFGPVLLLPRGTDALTRVLAYGSLMCIIAFSGVALASLAGLLFALLAIYLILTQVLGVPLDLSGEGLFF